jgi:hypothetical protein
MAAMTQQMAFTAYVGQVERDLDGQIWAVLYCDGHVMSREQARSLRRGKRRVTDMLLSAADATAAAVTSTAPSRDRADLGCRASETSLGRAGWHRGGRWRPAHLV